MRVVVDTNVLVSAFNFPGGAPETVVRLILENHVELATSQPLLLELARVLVDKFGWETKRSEEVIRFLLRKVDLVAPTEEIHEIKADPADNRVLEAALAGRAEIIVSGDRHILKLRNWRGIRMMNPAGFLEEFEHRTEG